MCYLTCKNTKKSDYQKKTIFAEILAKVMVDIKALIKSDAFKEFIRFCIVGVIATAIHYGIYLLLNLWINVNVAYTLGYAISFCCNLFLTAKFTFKKEITTKRTGGFILCHGVNYLLHMLFLNLFLWIGVAEQWAPIPVYCLVVPINFLLVRTVFKRFS